MSKRLRRNHSLAFKAKVALAAVKGDKTVAEMAQQYNIRPNLINQWRSELLEGVADVFGSEPAATNQRSMSQKLLCRSRAFCAGYCWVFVGTEMLMDFAGNVTFQASADFAR